MKFLDKIRKKDSAAQDSFTFLVSFGVTFFIFIIWLLTMIYGFTNHGVNNTASPIEIFSEKTKSLFSGTETYKAE